MINVLIFVSVLVQCLLSTAGAGADDSESHIQQHIQNSILLVGSEACIS